MNRNIVKEGILGVLKIQWQSLFKNYRLRVKNTVETVQASSGKDFMSEVGIAKKGNA